MKKLLILVLAVAMILGGCSQIGRVLTGSKNQKLDLNTTPTPPASTSTPSVDQNNNSTEKMPTIQDFENLQKKLDATTDEKEREKILAQMQKMLDQVEKK